MYFFIKPILTKSFVFNDSIRFKSKPPCCILYKFMILLMSIYFHPFSGHIQSFLHWYSSLISHLSHPSGIPFIFFVCLSIENISLHNSKNSTAFNLFFLPLSIVHKLSYTNQQNNNYDIS